MINWLNIKNLALVEHAEIEFEKGFNVITGETGAGKSVIMGAISLLLGERAGKNMIRKETEKCEICAEIDLTETLQSRIESILTEAGVDLTEDKLLIKRNITYSGARNFINDTPVTLQTLKLLGDLLIDIHAAHEHQSLLRNSIQLDILDDFGKHTSARKNTFRLYESLKEIEQRSNELEKNLPSAVEAEHLKTILKSIESADIDLEKDNDLNEKHKLAAHSKDILEFSSKASYALNESEESIINHLSELRRELSSLEKLNVSEAQGFISQCEMLIESTRELAYDIENFAGKIEIDEKEFIQMEERLLTIQTLKRKYGPTLEDVIKTAEEARSKLDDMENYAHLREELANQTTEAEKSLKKACDELSLKRKDTSAKLAKKVTSELKKLGFLKADFKIDFTESAPGPNGADSIEFMFTANPGEKTEPLRKVASSGEISRVMLALKTVIAESDSVPVLIFDEIDVNIGGKTAGVVGEELKKLGKTHQLICISHLPQVAANADSHFKVDKSISKKRTFTEIQKLDKVGQKEEITRMLGGGKAAEAHASELLSH
jgi:DNA repair protein RecN (Recombination protein N)